MMIASYDMCAYYPKKNDPFCILRTKLALTSVRSGKQKSKNRCIQEPFPHAVDSVDEVRSAPCGGIGSEVVRSGGLTWAPD